MSFAREPEWQHVSTSRLAATLRSANDTGDALPWSWYGPLTSSASASQLGASRKSAARSPFVADSSLRCPLGPMVPIKRYGSSSYRPDIGVKDLFKMAPGVEPPRPDTSVRAGPTSPPQRSNQYTRSISHYRSNGVYTHPGTYDERISMVGYRTYTRPKSQRASLAPLMRSPSTDGLNSARVGTPFKWTVSAL
jgi:hypothetical protein